MYLLMVVLVEVGKAQAPADLIQLLGMAAMGVMLFSSAAQEVVAVEQVLVLVGLVGLEVILEQGALVV
ncbi:hypothetical protein DPM18_05115 [Polynucleobacter paneuropaeus]|nr:hypothetical protein DPM18_05115 [Polynucleobacter paneuropaeus]